MISSNEKGKAQEGGTALWRIDRRCVPLRGRRAGGGHCAAGIDGEYYGLEQFRDGPLRRVVLFSGTSDARANGLPESRRNRE